MYTCGVYNGMLPLDEVTQKLSKSFHKAAINAFPHKRMSPNLVKSYKIVGIMRNVVIHGDVCNVK